MPTRDSAVWWLAIAAALVTYMMSAEQPPWLWTYQQWLQFVAAAIATVSGKLATSPLPGKPEEG